MKQYSIVLCVLLCSNLAFAQMDISQPFGGSTIEYSMRSVNSIDTYSTGSRYSSQVFEVGASTPMASSSIRKAPPGGGGTSTYDP